MNKIIQNYIDKGISFVEKHKEYLMYEADVSARMMADFDQQSIKGKSIKMELEQPDAATQLLEIIKPEDAIWKPIDSTVSDEQILELEKHFDISLPHDYKEYLKYKHFYTIFLNAEARLYATPDDEWQDILIAQNEEMKEVILDKGYFAIGNYCDYGEICFDLNNKNTEPQIVMIDYGTCEPDILAENFITFLSDALAMPEPILKELKPWQKKMYKME